MKNLICLILTMSSVSFASVIPFNEYRQELKEMTLNGHRPITSYRSARKHIMQNVHIRKDKDGYYVKDVYCRIDFRNKISPTTMPNANYINIEHTWPRSRFNKKENHNYQVADLHHLFPTESKSNSKRGNRYFNQFKSGRAVSDNCMASVTGIIPETGDMGFEPPDEHKGNVARTLFYFSIRYNLRIPAYEEFYLRQWNLIDPVDSEEIARNDEIENIQGNRNPFVDDPDLAILMEDF